MKSAIASTLTSLSLFSGFLSPLVAQDFLKGESVIELEQGVPAPIVSEVPS